MPLIKHHMRQGITSVNEAIL